MPGTKVTRTGKSKVFAIEEIKPYPVTIGIRNRMFVKVVASGGTYGWGESGVLSRELAVDGAVKHYAEWLIGRDPMRRGALWQEMYRSQYFEGGRVLAGAISAIDIALHDLAGKKLGVPVYQLLGGKHRDWVPTFASGWGTDTNEVVSISRAILAAGWNCIRMHLHYPGMAQENLFEPREHIAASAECFIKLREAVGIVPVIGTDYHHRLSVAEAASFCQMLPPHTLDFVEEPIRDESPEAYDALRKMTPVPFAIGEEFSSKWQALPYIERGLTNYMRVDVCNIGGLTEAMKVAGWCEAHYIDLMPHNPLGSICVAATAHLATAVPNFSWLEIRESPGERSGYYSKEIYPVQPEIAPGRVTLRDLPGLGIEVDESSLTGPFRFFEMPHLHRRDGSHTNF
jgi:galactonate dehydratase